MRNLVKTTALSLPLPLLLLASTAFAAEPHGERAAGRTLDLVVDASDPTSNILHARETIPVHAGENVLVYPRWIPGEHGPTGPLSNLAGLRVTANTKPLAWRRDTADMYTITVTVPAGVSSITVDLDLATGSGGDYTASGSRTPNLVDVSWNQLLLYPRGAHANAVSFTPHLRLPEGWSYATALNPPGGGQASATEHARTIDFSPVTLETLVDSPVISGRYLKSYDLGTVRGAPHALSVVSDSAEAVIAPPALVGEWKNLVVEGNALFGARHYDSYRFLLTASDHVAWFGLEHHQSSDDRVQERMLVEPDLQRTFANLLPHEYVHSWNGKHRRPKGLATPDYQQPMRGDLLWVYEGLTHYLGWVLMARSGLASFDDSRDFVARAVRTVDVPGRTWRPLVDTATAAQISGGGAGASLRRGVDYYEEGLLIWLEADVIIRQQTGGARSLDDFCQRFHGVADGGAAVRPYDLAEVVRTLNGVAPYDWKKFFDERIYQVAPTVPLGGVEGAGYRVVYVDKKPETLGLREKAFKHTSYGDSLGISLDKDDNVSFAQAGSPAGKAGITEGVTILAVDGRKMSSEVMKDALARAKTGSAPIELLVETDGFYRTVKVDWHGGERYRVLERDPSKPDLLEKIMSPRVARAATAPTAAAPASSSKP